MGSQAGMMRALLRAARVPMTGDEPDWRLAGRSPSGIVADVGDALFGDRRSTKPPPDGPIDHTMIDARMRELDQSIGRNLEAAGRTGDPNALSGAYLATLGEWVGKVRPGGPWDDKKRGPDRRQDLERMGNYSYGATAAALGLPLWVAEAGAGVVQRAQNVPRALRGQSLTPSVGVFRAPFGDDPRDPVAIEEGYAYGKSRLRGR